jgi:hypothetical protein
MVSTTHSQPLWAPTRFLLALLRPLLVRYYRSIGTFVVSATLSWPLSIFIQGLYNIRFRDKISFLKKIAINAAIV